MLDKVAETVDGVKVGQPVVGQEAEGGEKRF